MTTITTENDPIKILRQQLPSNYVEATKFRLEKKGIKKWDSQISDTANGKRHDVVILDELELLAKDFQKVNENRTFKLKKFDYAS